VRTDTEKLCKLMEFKIQIFQAWEVVEYKLNGCCIFAPCSCFGLDIHYHCQHLRTLMQFIPGLTTMSDKKSYCKLWNVVQMVLVLSHGQATVERGFSVNRQTEAENLDEQTVVARRIICDHVQFVGGIDRVDVCSKQLILAAAAAARL